MAKQDYTKEIKKSLRKYNLSAQQKAFADLLILGWDEMDAYLVTSIYNPAYSLSANVQDMTNLRATESFTKYYNDRVALLNKSADDAIENARQMFSENGDIDYRSKDVIIDQLGLVASDVRGKERAEILMKIADLQQMKKDEVKDVEKVVHFYIPVGCPKTCKLFKE